MNRAGNPADIANGAPAVHFCLNSECGIRVLRTAPGFRHLYCSCHCYDQECQRMARAQQHRDDTRELWEKDRKLFCKNENCGVPAYDHKSLFRTGLCQSCYKYEGKHNGEQRIPKRRYEAYDLKEDSDSRRDKGEVFCRNENCGVSARNQKFPFRKGLCMPCYSWQRAHSGGQPIPKWRYEAQDQREGSDSRRDKGEVFCRNENCGIPARDQKFPFRRGLCMPCYSWQRTHSGGQRIPKRLKGAKDQREDSDSPSKRSKLESRPRSSRGEEINNGKSKTPGFQAINAVENWDGKPGIDVKKDDRKEDDREESKGSMDIRYILN